MKYNFTNWNNTFAPNQSRYPFDRSELACARHRVLCFAFNFIGSSFAHFPLWFHLFVCPKTRRLTLSWSEENICVIINLLFAVTHFRHTQRRSIRAHTYKNQSINTSTLFNRFERKTISLKLPIANVKTSELSFSSFLFFSLNLLLVQSTFLYRFKSQTTGTTTISNELSKNHQKFRQEF